MLARQRKLIFLILYEMNGSHHSKSGNPLLTHTLPQFSQVSTFRCYEYR